MRASATRLKNRPRAPASLVAAVDKRLLNDPRHYFASLDLNSLWEEWYLGMDESGKPKYRNLRQFVNAVAEGPVQKKFLMWYLGPPTQKNDPTYSRYYTFVKAGPVDWMRRRDEGGWFTDANLARASIEITKRMNAYERMAAAGMKYMLFDFERAERYSRTIDKYIRGEIMVPGLSLDANVGRAKSIVALQQQIGEFKANILRTFALSQGLNFEDMSGLLQIVQATAAMAQQQLDSGQVESKEQNFLKAFAAMTVRKATKYDKPLPKELEAAAIDIVAEEESDEEGGQVQ